ncbi:unnamed protein product [Rodentolepis nana]|uniref:Stromal cell-derived factor 2 n=1 Tax=Rodentolepis nana TaxID=102285 RepID=A0A0R3TKI6_RODNA|nr:unnamed protein product [Rodentolepis nana]
MSGRFCYFLFGILGICAISSEAITNVVTYGSQLKLLNTVYNVRLHSHDIGYGSGSGQQSVTGLQDVTQKGSYWVIHKDHLTGNNYYRGEPVKCGQIIRLTHMETNKNLHSHHFQAPISRNLEVSAFGTNGNGDEGDNWELICSGDMWTRGDEIKLRHVITASYLHVSGNTYQHPIPGQFEVAASSSTYGSVWKAAEGVFIQPSNMTLKSNGKHHEEL